MAPLPAPKRIKRPSVVLDEDSYTSAVSHIIRRDFFPGLVEADAQREYLNAVESKDRSWIREAGKKLTQVMTPAPHGRTKIDRRTRSQRPSGDVEKTPSVWGADTPVRTAETVTPEDEEGMGKLDHVDLDLSLGAFQAKYISEDQESFSQIIDKQNKVKFEKGRWAREGNMYASKQRIAQEKVLQARMTNGTSQELAVIPRPSQNLDDRPAAPNFHKHTAFNTLMFGPDSVEQWAPTRAQVAENASLAPPKKVLYNNTRLPAPETEPRQPPSPTLSAVRDAIAGRPRLNPSEVGYTGSETPRVNGYAFVDAHPPSPEPDSDSDDSAPEDLLTRFGVDSASKATPFTINDASAREKMHHRMVDRIGAQRSNPHVAKAKPPSAGLGIFTSETPRFLSAPTPVRLAGGKTPGRKGKGDLTPAAQRLFENMGRRGSVKGSGEGGFGDREMGRGKEWTPTTRVNRKV